MSDRVRVQLQQGHKDIDSVKKDAISAEETIASLSKLYKDNKKYKNDSQWEKEFGSAIKKATDWIKRIQQAGGFVPRGSGTAQSFKFDYDGEEYRIDIETHGSKESDWFK
jgi:hypothetical protein